MKVGFSEQMVYFLRNMQIKMARQLCISTSLPSGSALTACYQGIYGYYYFPLSVTNELQEWVSQNFTSSCHAAWKGNHSEGCLSSPYDKVMVRLGQHFIAFRFFFPRRFSVFIFLSPQCDKASKGRKGNYSKGLHKMDGLLSSKCDKAMVRAGFT